LNSETKQRIYNELVNSNGKTLFDLTKLPLFSLKLVKYDENEYRLLMVVHHLIFDGWSLYLFIERLAKKYNNEPADKSRWRNVDYVHYLRSPRNLSRIEKEREYWTGELKNLPDAWSMPLQKDACFADTGKYGRRYWWTVDKHLSLAIEELALELRVTPFSVFMSAFQLSLAAFSGVSDVIVGTPFAGRNNENISQLIGYYTNMVCIRLSWNQEDTTHQLIQQCNQKAIGAFTNATIPFGELVKTIRKSAKMGKNPFYQAIMVKRSIFKGLVLSKGKLGTILQKLTFY
jgi:hypothetical protein